MMIKKYLLMIVLLACFGCSQNSSDSVDENDETPLKTASKDTVKKEEATPEKTTPKEEPISEIEKKLIDAGLVDVQDIDSSLHVDVKYATTDNFMGRVLYPNYRKVYLQKDVAERLSKAQNALQKKDTNLTFLVFDGARPRSVQQDMWDAMDTIPLNERVKFLSNPANGSIHNFGCAVDLTIMNKTTGEWLDMGAGYDDLRKIAYPRHEERFLKEDRLTKQQVENRKLLRKMMKVGGFYVIQTEWWHFNAFTRPKAKELYDIIE